MRYLRATARIGSGASSAKVSVQSGVPSLNTRYGLESALIEELKRKMLMKLAREIVSSIEITWEDVADDGTYG